MDFSIFYYAYAVSGGIGSGKSSVCSYFKQMGYKTIDADLIAHQALEVKKEEIIQIFGDGILQDDLINRQRLGEIVFSCAELLKKLEEVVHPYVAKEIFLQCERLEREKKLFFVEIPLLFELKEIFNFRNTLLVVASMQNQILRLALRNKMNENEAKKRIKAQMPFEKKIALAKFVIDNDGSKEELQKKLKLWLQGLKSNNI